MLDTLMAQRPALRRLQSALARTLWKLGLRANQATVLGGIVGVIAGILFACRATALGIVALLLSGALDAIDGAIARQCATPTRWGGILDLTLDRVVEAAVLLGIVWRNPGTRLPAAIVLATWYVNITVFMATGAAVGGGEKLIYYPPGLVERTEALLFFVLLAVAPASLKPLLCYAYAALEIGTTIQRLRYAYRAIAE